MWVDRYVGRQGRGLRWKGGWGNANIVSYSMAGQNNIFLRVETQSGLFSITRMIHQAHKKYKSNIYILKQVYSREQVCIWGAVYIVCAIRSRPYNFIIYLYI